MSGESICETCKYYHELTDMDKLGGGWYIKHKKTGFGCVIETQEALDTVKLVKGWVVECGLYKETDE